MRPIIILLAVVLVLLQYRLWVSEDGFSSVWSLGDSIESQQIENRELAQRNEQLEAEVRDLKQGKEAIEEIARNDLGMIGPGETFYLIAAPESTDDDSGA